jgi:hypothetical protein
MIRIAAIQVGFVLLAFSTASGAGLVDATNAQRTALLSALDPSAHNGFRPSLVSDLSEPVPEDLSCEARSLLLTRLVYNAQCPEKLCQALGYLTGPFLAVVVGATEDSCGGIREDANRSLVDAARAADLSPYASQLKAAYRADSSRVSALRVYALLPLDDAERAEALVAAIGRPPIRARLGDTAAEASIIARFEAAETFDAKSEAAEELGYVGTVAAGAALARGLQSTLVAERPVELVSIRMEILEALGRIHRDEALFHQDFWLAAFGREEGNQDEYLANVASWAAQTYGVDLQVPVPTPVLRIDTPHVRY